MKREKMERLKNKITIENALCLFIVLCPILDILSFIFRKSFETCISPSTFLRPVITIAVAIEIFIKHKFKRKNCFDLFNLFCIWSGSS